MAFQFSVAARNAAANAIEAAIGASPVLRIRTGPPPANAAAARQGTILAQITLPADVWADAVNGSKSLNAVSGEAIALATGEAGHFEVMQGSTCHIQGTVTAAGGGGDMTLPVATIVEGQPVRANALTFSALGA